MMMRLIRLSALVLALGCTFSAQAQKRTIDHPSVDFRATSCGPCIANIRSSKEQRKAFEAAGKLTYVFITENRQSPQVLDDRFDLYNLEEELKKYQ